MGRPTKYSDWRAGAICAHLRSGATRTAAVAAAGVSYDAFRRWIKSNAEFASAVMQAEAECAVAMSKVIFDAAMAGDAMASAGLQAAGQLLGLLQVSPASWFQGGDDSAWIETAIAERIAARKARDFARADAIRADLAAKGVLLEDNAGGTTWRLA